MLQSTYHAVNWLIYFIDTQSLSFHLLDITWNLASVQVVNRVLESNSGDFKPISVKQKLAVVHEVTV